MAQLNSSNVTNGNIVESNDILQLYDAFTAGGGTTGVYNVSISGSLTGSATSASYASTALSASYSETSLSSSFAVSSSRSVTSSYALTSLSSSFAVSSSRSVTSSYALTATSAISASHSDVTDTINEYLSFSGSNFGSQIFSTAAGSIFATASLAAITASFLAGKTLGTDAFINVTALGSGVSTSVRSFNQTIGGVQFQVNGGVGNELFMYMIVYKAS